MNIPHKPSQPRQVRFRSQYTPIPENATPELKTWWASVMATFNDDHQTIEDALVRQDEAIQALQERVATLEADAAGAPNP